MGKPKVGQKIWDLDDDCQKVWDGSQWQPRSDKLPKYYIEMTEELMNDLLTSEELLSDCRQRFKELEGKGICFKSYRNGYLDSFYKNVVSKIKKDFKEL